MPRGDDSYLGRHRCRCKAPKTGECSSAERGSPCSHVSHSTASTFLSCCCKTTIKKYLVLLGDALPETDTSMTFNQNCPVAYEQYLKLNPCQEFPSGLTFKHCPGTKFLSFCAWMRHVIDNKYPPLMVKRSMLLCYKFLKHQSNFNQSIQCI